MNYLERAKEQAQIAGEHQLAGHTATQEVYERAAQLNALISIAESLATLASAVTPNFIDGYPSSINVDKGWG